MLHHIRAELSQYQKYTRMSSPSKLRDCANWGYLNDSAIQSGHRHSTNKEPPCFPSDFREVNKRLIIKPFPIPKISTVLQKLEGFTFATALDLNMGYDTIRLDPDVSKICTINFPWPMGMAGSPDFFQDGANGILRVCMSLHR